MTVVLPASASVAPVTVATITAASRPRPAAAAHARGDPPDRGAVRFVALGDSTTVGLGDPVVGGGWRGWAALLAAALGPSTSLTNLAACGATAAVVRRAQLPVALGARPALASLVVGVNDTMRSSFDPARVAEDLLATAEALSATGALLLTVRLHDHGQVFGLPGMLRRPLWRRIEAVNAAYDRVHAACGGIRLDLADLPWTYRRETWSVDRLHPAEAGHRRLAALFAARLAERGWPVDGPLTEGCDGVAPSRLADTRWMLCAGLPWLGRRVGDLGPWAARMAARDVRATVDRALRGPG